MLVIKIITTALNIALLISLIMYSLSEKEKTTIFAIVYFYVMSFLNIWLVWI